MARDCRELRNRGNSILPGHAATLTRSRSQPISHARLKALRSTLLIAIVSLFVLTGYARAVMDKCCAMEQTERAAHDGSVPVEEHGCSCLCHQVFSNVFAMPVRLPAVVLVLQAVRLPADEFPPDAVPPGIDVPPQLS